MATLREDIYNEFHKIIDCAFFMCTIFKHEYITPEHALLDLTSDNVFTQTCSHLGIDSSHIHFLLGDYLDKMDKVEMTDDYSPIFSVQFVQMMERAYDYSLSTPSEGYQDLYMIEGLLDLSDSFAADTFRGCVGNDDHILEFIQTYIHFLESSKQNNGASTMSDTEIQLESDGMLICMNEMLEGRNPLIGREPELKRTIEVLCRKEKNNPLHIGEPGVGKTALVWGLVRKIVEGDVPERLKNSKVYMLDVGSMLASSQYRGEMEKKLKESMDSLSKSNNCIIYIDDIHTMIGAGRSGDSAVDATDLLKPYMENGHLRFIGSTTYDDFKRYLERNRGLTRRFQTIDIMEPSVEETINILMQLRPGYEAFHNVIYSDDAIRYAVEASAKYLSNRFLPDKAIDLIDEAGARMELHPNKTRKVSKELLASILSDISKIGTIKVDDSVENLIATLDKRILGKIYGQDTAVKSVVEAIQMSKAGLSEEGKPLASLLFVGPTGVGKTEIARVLASEMRIELIRFDMSEYTEKHTVAKLIGSPSGYVGYDDGGLLTDAIRRSPNCVLLLDEIEKAHSDIYNLLLQIMDYAILTDNKGKKADFRNVVLIMTSNAGAQYANQASVGFAGGLSRGEAMNAQVKKLFKPEFLNRLTSIVTFNDMDETMARMILKKKLRELGVKLSSRNVSLNISSGAFSVLLKEGFSKEYGAREMDRVIGTHLKPILMREILYGKLKNGGDAHIIQGKNGIQIK